MTAMSEFQGGGQGGFVEQVSTPLTFPVSLTVSVKSIALAWSAVPGAIRYAVYCGRSPQAMVLVADGLEGTAYTIGSLALGGAYYVQVLAILSPRAAIASYFGGAGGSIGIGLLPALTPLEYNTGGCGDVFAPVDLDWPNPAPGVLYQFNGQSTEYNNTIAINLSNVVNSSSIQFIVMMDAAFQDTVQLYLNGGSFITNLSGPNATTTLTFTADGSGNVTVAST